MMRIICELGHSVRRWWLAFICLLLLAPAALWSSENSPPDPDNPRSIAAFRLEGGRAFGLTAFWTNRSGGRRRQLQTSCSRIPMRANRLPNGQKSLYCTTATTSTSV